MNDIELPTSAPEPTPWLTVAQTADRSHRHTKTVLAALRRGQLLGYQNTPGAPWVAHVEDVDAWIRKEKPGKRRTPKRANTAA